MNTANVEEGGEMLEGGLQLWLSMVRLFFATTELGQRQMLRGDYRRTFDQWNETCSSNGSQTLQRLSLPWEKCLRRLLIVH